MKSAHSLLRDLCHIFGEGGSSDQLSIRSGRWKTLKKILSALLDICGSPSALSNVSFILLRDSLPNSGLSPIRPKKKKSSRESVLQSPEEPDFIKEMSPLYCIFALLHAQQSDIRKLAANFLERLLHCRESVTKKLRSAIATRTVLKTLLVDSSDDTMVWIGVKFIFHSLAERIQSFEALLETVKDLLLRSNQQEPSLTDRLYFLCKERLSSSKSFDQRAALSMLGAMVHIGGTEMQVRVTADKKLVGRIVHIIRKTWSTSERGTTSTAGEQFFPTEVQADEELSDEKTTDFDISTDSQLDSSNANIASEAVTMFNSTVVCACQTLVSLIVHGYEMSEVGHVQTILNEYTQAELMGRRQAVLEDLIDVLLRWMDVVHDAVAAATVTAEGEDAEEAAAGQSQGDGSAADADDNPVFKLRSSAFTLQQQKSTHQLFLSKEETLLQEQERMQEKRKKGPRKGVRKPQMKSTASSTTVEDADAKKQREYRTVAIERSLLFEIDSLCSCLSALVLNSQAADRFATSELVSMLQKHLQICTNVDSMRTQVTVSHVEIENPPPTTVSVELVPKDWKPSAEPKSSDTDWPYDGVMLLLHRLLTDELGTWRRTAVQRQMIIHGRLISMCLVACDSADTATSTKYVALQLLRDLCAEQRLAASTLYTLRGVQVIIDLLGTRALRTLAAEILWNCLQTVHSVRPVEDVESIVPLLLQCSRCLPYSGINTTWPMNPRLARQMLLSDVKEDVIETAGRHQSDSVGGYIQAEMHAVHPADGYTSGNILPTDGRRRYFGHMDLIAALTDDEMTGFDSANQLEGPDRAYMNAVCGVLWHMTASSVADVRQYVCDKLVSLGTEFTDKLVASCTVCPSALELLIHCETVLSLRYKPLLLHGLMNVFRTEVPEQWCVYALMSMKADAFAVQLASANDGEEDSSPPTSRHATPWTLSRRNRRCRQNMEHLRFDARPFWSMLKSIPKTLNTVTGQSGAVTDSGSLEWLALSLWKLSAEIQQCRQLVSESPKLVAFLFEQLGAQIPAQGTPQHSEHGDFDSRPQSQLVPEHSALCRAAICALFWNLEVGGFPVCTIANISPLMMVTSLLREVAANEQHSSPTLRTIASALLSRLLCGSFRTSDSVAVSMDSARGLPSAPQYLRTTVTASSGDPMYTPVLPPIHGIHAGNPAPPGIPAPPHSSRRAATARYERSARDVSGKKRSQTAREGGRRRRRSHGVDIDEVTRFVDANMNLTGRNSRKKISTEAALATTQEILDLVIRFNTWARIVVDCIRTAKGVHRQGLVNPVAAHPEADDGQKRGELGGDGPSDAESDNDSLVGATGEEVKPEEGTANSMLGTAKRPPTSSFSKLQRTRSRLQRRQHSPPRITQSRVNSLDRLTVLFNPSLTPEAGLFCKLVIDVNSSSAMTTTDIEHFFFRSVNLRLVVHAVTCLGNLCATYGIPIKEYLHDAYDGNALPVVVSLFGRLDRYFPSAAFPRELRVLYCQSLANICSDHPRNIHQLLSEADINILDLCVEELASPRFSDPLMSSRTERLAASARNMSKTPTSSAKTGTRGGETAGKSLRSHRKITIPTTSVKSTPVAGPRKTDTLKVPTLDFKNLHPGSTPQSPGQTPLASMRSNSGVSAASSSSMFGTHLSRADSKDYLSRKEQIMKYRKWWSYRTIKDEKNGTTGAEATASGSDGKKVWKTIPDVNWNDLLRTRYIAVYGKCRPLIVDPVAPTRGDRHREQWPFINCTNVCDSPFSLAGFHVKWEVFLPPS